MTWTQRQAIDLCRQIEDIAPEHGCHVALTGGTLYKDGARKDCDVLFYRIRDAFEIDGDGLFKALASLGVVVDIERPGDYGDEDDCWVFKASHENGPMDLFFPEAPHVTEVVDKTPQAFRDQPGDVES